MLKRNFFVALSYPGTAWFVFLSKLGKLPGFTVVIHRDHDALVQAKARNTSDGQPIGWAMMDKRLELKLLGFKIAQTTLGEGESLTAEHFWFDRSPREIQALLTLAQEAGRPIALPRGASLFEPGCGPGKFLFYLSDKYGLQPFGADVYEPAIKVGRAACLGKSACLEVVDLVGSDYLDRIPDRRFDIILLASHLAHVQHLEGFEKYLDNLFRIADCILIVERDAEGIAPRLVSRGAEIIKNDGTIYAVRRPRAGSESQSATPSEYHPQNAG